MLRPFKRSVSLLSGAEKRHFFSLTLARILAQLLDLLGIAAVGGLAASTAALLSGSAQISLVGLEIRTRSEEDVLLFAVAVVALFSLKSGISAFLLRRTTRFLASVEAKNAIQIVEYLFTGDLQRLHRYSNADLMWTANQSSQVAFSGILFSGSALIAETSLFAMVFFGFLLVDAPVAIAASLYFGLILTVFQLAINQRIRRLGERLSTRQVEISQSVIDLSKAYRELTVSGQKKEFFSSFANSRTGFADDRGLQRFVMGLPRFLVETSLVVGVLSLLAWQFSMNTFQDGLFLSSVFLAGGLRIMGSLLPLQNAIADLRISGPQASRAHEIIAAARTFNSEVSPNFKNSDSTPSEGHEVRFSNVSFSYHNSSDTAVKNLSFSVSAGSVCALIGPSGAGKSTISDLTLGLLHPSEGTVTVSGVLPSRLHQNGSGVAYVPQNSGLISGSIAANICLSLNQDSYDHDRIAELVEITGLGSVVRSMEHGVMTDLGSHQQALSGGQIQRLGLARALYKNPKLLVLDEATSSLDAETEKIISDLVFSLEETTVLIIAHRLSTVTRADNVLVLEDGEIVGQGTFEEVRATVPLVSRHIELLNIS